MKFLKINTIIIIVISIVSGLLAGFLGCLLFLAARTINIPLIGKLEKYLPQREITIQTQEKVTVERDTLLGDSLKQIKGQMVRFFIAKAPLTNQNINQNLSENLLSQAYAEKDALGSGFILTSDGWLVTSKSVISSSKNSYLALTDDNKFYPVQKIIEDTLTGVVFIKISAVNLQVASLTDKDSLILGQEALVFNKNKDLTINFLSQIKNCPDEQKGNLIRNTEKFCEFLKLGKDLDNNFKGSALVALDQSVIGIAGDNGIIPSYYFKYLLNQTFKNGKIERPTLGIDFIELSSVALSDDNLIKTLGNKGILIYRVIKNSPAQKAGLLKDDIILKINNDSINGQFGLTELIQDYKKGDTLKLTIIREGKNREINLKL